MRDGKVSDPIELRQGVATDAAAIRELTREAYAKWVPIIGREPKPMTVDYAEAVRNHRFDLLYVEGKLAALIETVPEADHLLIENVAVSPVFQGRGFGRMLMARAEQVAVSLGFSKTRLYTNKLFTENVQIYRKLGYSVDREEEFKGGFAVHMSKPLRR
jgi:GNAT superfamily N-acetyltransferase